VNHSARSFTQTVDVPYLTYHDSPGSKVRVHYVIYSGKKIVAQDWLGSTLLPDQTTSFKVKFKPAKGAYYQMKVLVNDKHNQEALRWVELVPE
jgi:hypothetical protein